MRPIKTAALPAISRRKKPNNAAIPIVFAMGIVFLCGSFVILSADKHGFLFPHPAYCPVPPAQRGILPHA